MASLGSRELDKQPIWVRCLFVLVVCLVGNVGLLLATASLTYIGGPILWFGQFGLTLMTVIAYAISQVVNRPTIFFGAGILSAIAVPVLLIVGMVLTLRDHELGTKKLFAEREALPLPKGCAFGGMYIGRTSIFHATCTGSAEAIVRDYERRGEGWVRVNVTESGATTIRQAGRSAGLVIGPAPKGIDITIEAPDYTGPWYGAHGP